MFEDNNPFLKYAADDNPPLPQQVASDPFQTTDVSHIPQHQPPATPPLPVSHTGDTSLNPFASPQRHAPLSSEDIIPQTYATKIISLPGTNVFVRIVMQNENGPCSLLTLVNILSLRQDIALANQESISSDDLFSTLSTFITTPEFTPQVFNRMLMGLNLNPRFGAVDGFASTADPLDSAAFSVFEQANITLLHGWLADPSSDSQWDALVGSSSNYEEATLTLVHAQDLCDQKGLDVSIQGPNSDEDWQIIQLFPNWDPAEQTLLSRAFAIHDFFTTNASQLSYHGLSQLKIQTGPNLLYALYRNSHFLILYHTHKDNFPLLTLVTDASFGNFSEIVWESLADIDGSASQFFNADLKLARVAQQNHIASRRRASIPSISRGSDVSDSFVTSAQKKKSKQKLKDCVLM